MKRLQLAQPYASMVMAGVLQTLPDKWGNVKYGERIFIYADDLDDEFCNGPNYSKALHRKIYNGMFMGNLPDGEFPTRQFLGYVRVHHKGIIDTDWVKDEQQTIFVGVPYKLTTIISDFDCDENTLEKASSHKVTLKSIQKKGYDLYVPVCKNVWKRLHNNDECLGVCMFWENYMSAYTSCCFSLECADIEEVDEIHFQYGNKTISFITDGGVGQDIVSEYSKDKVVSLLSFNLRYRKDKYTVVELGGGEKLEGSQSKSRIDKNDVEDIEPSLKEYRPYIRFISTPMCGMTRWKR